MSPTKPLTLESFSRYQLIVIGICWLITLMNGFCILAISFTAPVIAKDWSVEPAALGVVLGASFVGMALGSLALAPLADYVGRRWIVLGAVGTLGISMLVTALTHTVPQLTAARFLTGFAEGTMLPSMTAMVAEYSPDRSRNLSISIMQIAYPLGGTAAGFLTIYLMHLFRWTSVFVGGAASTLAVGALALVALPESLDFLASRRDPRSLGKANRILGRMNHPALDAWPAEEASAEAKKVGIKALLHGENAKWTVLYWIGFFCTMFGTYFVMVWLPKLVVDAGLTFNNAAAIGAILNIGAVLGILWIGFGTSGPGRLRWVIVWFSVISFVLMAYLGRAPAHVWLLTALAIFLGLTSNGSFVGLYVVGARLYDTSARATGIGWGIGIGRAGAIVSPIIAGVLLGMGWSQKAIYAVLAIPFLVAAVAVGMLRARRLG
jgi:MFS transporter, AAHS family, vanillate permease